MQSFSKKLSDAVSDPSGMFDSKSTKRDKTKREFEERQKKQYEDGKKKGVVDEQWETTQSYSVSEVSAITPEKRRESRLRREQRQTHAEFMKKNHEKS